MSDNPLEQLNRGIALAMDDFRRQQRGEPPNPDPTPRLVTVGAHPCCAERAAYLAERAKLPSSGAMLVDESKTLAERTSLAKAGAAASHARIIASIASKVDAPRTVGREGPRVSDEAELFAEAKARIVRIMGWTHESWAAEVQRCEGLGVAPWTVAKDGTRLPLVKPGWTPETWAGRDRG